MMKLRTKIMLLVFCVVAAILLLNQYPVSMSVQQSVLDASGRAMQDIIYQASASPELMDGLITGNRTVLRKVAARIEESDSCTGVAFVGRGFQVYYNSPEDGIEDKALAECRENPPENRGYWVVNGEEGKSIIYAYCPVYGENGEPVGGIISKLLGTRSHPAIQKAQRDLNAMTILVMLIALVFVWDLTDNITGTMFNLEPVEIAQLLVERNALIDAVRDGILSVDQEGRLIHTNRTALELFQRVQPDFDPKTSRFDDLFPRVPFREMLKSDLPCYDTECLIGTDSFYANFIPIRVEKPQHESLLVTFRPKGEVVRFAEDITGVRSYIEALRAQMHEFNNKLQVMSGLVQGEKYAELEEYLYALVHLRNREIEQINRKVKDPILAAFLMSKFDRAAEQHVDLVLTDRTKLRCELTEELSQDLVVIVGNLLENAFDAVQNCDMQTVTLEMTEAAGDICVSVWDSGVEIPENLLDRLFDYGVTTKQDGNGIGLYLVQQACLRHNGYVAVTSDALNGTEFTAHISMEKNRENRYVPGIDC